MAKYQVAYVIKQYITKFIDAENPQDAWNKVKSNGVPEITIETYQEIDSLTSINEITEETIDTDSLDL